VREVAPHRPAAGLAWVAAPLAALVLGYAGNAPVVEASSKCPGENAPAGSISTERAERALACVVNRAREKRGLESLQRRNDLTAAARAHSATIVETGCFKHRCPGEESLAERLREYLDAGGSGYGESIANGAREFGSARTILRAWMKDDGNRANVLDEKFEHVGVGAAEGLPGSPAAKGFTFTVDFGRFGS
jgi:uncharacterized protein YkwD